MEVGALDTSGHSGGVLLHDCKWQCRIFWHHFLVSHQVALLCFSLLEMERFYFRDLFFGVGEVSPMRLVLLFSWCLWRLVTVSMDFSALKLSSCGALG